MSYLRLPRGSEGKLPSTATLTPTVGGEEAHKPIKATIWKCRRQLIGTLIVCLGVFAVGTVFGWAAVTIPDLIKLNKIERTPEIEASVASIFVIGAMLAGPVAGYSMYHLGRKIVTFWFAVIFTFGWMFIPAAHWIKDVMASETLILIGRFITGFAGSGCLVMGPVYVRELCDDNVIRTTMASLVPLILGLGNAFCFFCGSLNWWILSIVCGMVPVALCFLIWFVPDTPRHLLLVGKDEEAHKAMLWLTVGFTPEEQERIFQKVKRGVELNERNQAAKKEENKRDRAHQLTWKSRPVFHPLILSILLIFFQQGSGNNVVATYTKQILEFGVNFVSLEDGTVIIGVFYFAVVVGSILVVERLGRRPLLLIGIVLQFTMQVMLGFFFFFANDSDEHMEYAIQHFSWIPVFCINLFIGGYAMGLGTVTWIMAAEINHPDFQELGSTLDNITYMVTAFVSMMTLPSLRDAISYHWCFWLYSIMNFLAFWFCLFFIPETKGKTHEDIMDHFRGSHIEKKEVEEVKSIGSIQDKSEGATLHQNFGRASGGSEGDSFNETLQTIYHSENVDTQKSLA